MGGFALFYAGSKERERRGEGGGGEREKGGCVGRDVSHYGERECFCVMCEDFHTGLLALPIFVTQLVHGQVLLYP